MSRTTTMHRMALDLSLDRALVPVGAGAGERLLPDPEWPVPPRGWHLWAAALPESRGARSSSGDDAPAGDDDRSDVDLTGDDETRPFVEADDAAFTLPSRPVLAPRETVDLLARPRARRLPEGSGLGFTLMAALVVLGTLIGGPTGGLVVLGVSTLLATSAAIILGRLTLNHVGGLRGGSLLLVVAVGALIAGSVDAAARREDAVQRGVPVPVSSPIASASGPASMTPVTPVVPVAPGRTSTELSAVPSVTGTLVPPRPHAATTPTAPTPRASATARTAEVVRAAATPTAPLLPADAFAPKPGLDGLAGLAGVAGTGVLPTGPAASLAPAKPLRPATTVKPPKTPKPAKAVKPAKPAEQTAKNTAKQAATTAKAQAKAAKTAARAARKSAARAARASR